jgi:hypothetical protein
MVIRGRKQAPRCRGSDPPKNFRGTWVGLGETMELQKLSLTYCSTAVPPVQGPWRISQYGRSRSRHQVSRRMDSRSVSRLAPGLASIGLDLICR